MVFHLVLFRPRADLQAADRRKLGAALETALGGIPSIRRFHIGARVTHGREYEQLMTADLAYAAVIEFDDLAGLEAYLRHPAHADLGARFMSSVEVGLVYDYEMKGIEGVWDLVTPPPDR